MSVSENPKEAAMVHNSNKIKLDLLVKKRNNQWDNEIYQNNVVPEKLIPLCYGDRFIPRRYSLVNIDRNQKFISKKSVKDVLKSRLMVNYWRQNGFTLAINKSFDIKDRRVLEFTDSLVKSSGLAPMDCLTTDSNDFICGSLNGFDWPCKPRSKPIAFTDTTHDLPGFDLFFDHNLVDWSVNGQIVASFGHDVIIWKRTEDVTMIFNIKCPRSLAYCPNGEFLAIGCKACKYPVLEIWDVNSFNDFVVVNGKVFNSKHGDVQCIEWSKLGNEIVCGTHFGTMFVLSVPDLIVLNKVRKHKLPVTMLRFSPTMRYLASGDEDGNIVIYNWSSCDVYLFVRSRRKLKVVFDWHPWNGVDLAISENVPASIVILHVPSKEIVAYYQRKDTKIVINSVTFSKITGELLVSISKHDAAGLVHFKILVMSSLDRVVDMLNIAESGARFMMWSPDGTCLATAGNDETLTIWNFYPGNKNKFLEKINLPLKCDKEKHILEANFGTQFKMWSNVK